MRITQKNLWLKRQRWYKPLDKTRVICYHNNDDREGNFLIYVAWGTIMKYDVTFTRYGFAEIEASSEEEAYAFAEAYGAEDISWSDEFCTSDVQEAE